MGGDWRGSPWRFGSLYADRHLSHQQAIARSHTRFAQSTDDQPIAPIESAARDSIPPQRHGLRSAVLPGGHALSPFFEAALEPSELSARPDSSLRALGPRSSNGDPR